MGTRGAFGFRIDGADKVTYNHFDSYPSGLGQDMLECIRHAQETMTPDQFADRARNIRMVDEDWKPTSEEIEQLKKYADQGVSTGSLSEPYVLMRELQRNPLGTLEAGIMINKRDFLADSLFCEWAYIINLDDECLEVYRGFQRNPHDKGRYAGLELAEESYSGQYFPVALIAEIPFSRLPEQLANTFYYDEDVDDYVVVQAAADRRREFVGGSMKIADRLKNLHEIFATAEKPGVAFAAAHIVVRRLSDGQAVTMVDELAQLAQIAVLAESLEIGEWPDPLPPDTVREIVEGIGFDETVKRLGVSPRTLESWIYGERNCTGPARKLLATEAVARGLEPG